MKKNPVADYIHSITSAGGRARAESLSKLERSVIAKKAAAARWKDHTAKRPASSRKTKKPASR